MAQQRRGNKTLTTQGPEGKSDLGAACSSTEGRFIPTVTGIKDKGIRHGRYLYGMVLLHHCVFAHNGGTDLIV